MCLGENFETHQTTRLHQLCGEEDGFRGDIDIAPLELSTQSREFAKLNKTRHFHHRKEILDIFIKSPSKIISHPQLFAEAERDAQNRAVTCKTEAAASKFIQRHSNQVFISGEPGIGKSTFSQQLVEEMLDPNTKLYETEFVFYVRFRDLDYVNEMDFLEFLTMHDPFLLHFAVQDRIKVLEHFGTCKNVSIVMDGFDEADIKSSANLSKCHLFAKATAVTFIKSLFFGDIFPFAKKIITSRPRQLAEWSNNILPQFFYVVNLLGLSDDGQRKICDSVCKNPIQSSKILNYVNSHPDLKSYCYVPVNAIVTMRILKETRENEWKQLDSLTSILVAALKVWFLRRLSQNKSVVFQAKEIAEMAYEAFCDDRFYFKKWHFNEMGVDLKNLMTFMTNVEFFLFNGTDIHCYFIHLMWQELFVAFKLILFTDEEKLNDIIPNLNVVKYEMVLKFLFGLCNEDTQTELLGQVEAKDLNSSTDRKKCKELLRNFAIEKIRESGGRNFESLIQVFGWIHEMRDDGFTVQAADCLNNKFFIQGHILPSDVPCLNYMLRHRTTPMTLCVKNPLFVGNSFEYFTKELKVTSENNSKIKVSHELKQCSATTFVVFFLLQMFTDCTEKSFFSIRKHL